MRLPCQLSLSVPKRHTFTVHAARLHARRSSSLPRVHSAVLLILNDACSVFPCQTPAEVRSKLPPKTDVVVFQCRNPVHRWAAGRCLVCVCVPYAIDVCLLI